MKITNLRFSFIQAGCASDALSSLNPPPVRFSFLLSAPAYQQRFTEASQAYDKHERIRPPWRYGFGKLFWKYYIQKNTARAKDLWRMMVPLYYDLGAVITADWLNGTIAARTYLYPWGIGLVLDIIVEGSFSVDEAANLGFQVDRLNKYKVTLEGGVQKELPLKGLMEFLLTSMYTEALNVPVAARASELFSIVTVLNAEDADPKQPLKEGGDLNEMMEAMVDWNPLFKSIPLPKLDSSKIDIKNSPAGHILFGGRRGRFVWYPGNFRSKVGSPNRLNCYHQNLTVASLQTESLCQFAQDISERLDGDGSLVNTSVTYQSCAQLTAGILGRMYGGASDIYRSGSIRSQIAKSYIPAVAAVRQYFKMSQLAP
jgi:hypothetical protein